VAGGEGGVEPLGDEHAHRRRPGDRRRRRGDPRLHLARHGIAALLDPDPAGDDPHRLGHLRQRARIEREHVGVEAAHAGHVLARDGADVAQVLGDDEVGLEVADQRVVERIERPAVEHGRAHRGVVVAASQLVRVDPRRRDDGELGNARRVVAFGGAPDEQIGAAERADDLGGAGEEGADAQAVSVSQPGTTAR
jgi:hypothetical protein